MFKDLNHVSSLIHACKDIKFITLWFRTLRLNRLSHKGSSKETDQYVGRTPWYSARTGSTSLKWSRPAYVRHTFQVCHAYTYRMVNELFGSCVIEPGFIGPHGPLWSKALGPRIGICNVGPFGPY